MWLNQQDEEKNTQQASPSIGSGGGVGAATPSTGNVSTTTPIQPPQNEQKFATVQDYLTANRPQEEALGQKVTSSLSDTYNKEKGDIDTAATGATNAANTASAYNPNIVSSALESPSAVTNNPDQFTNFMRQWNGEYSGPTSFENTENYGAAAKAANDATQKAEQLKTTGGREQLIQDQFNVYGQGNRGLDQALLQESSAFPQLQNLGKNFTSIPDYLASKAGEVNTTAIPTARTAAAANAPKAQTEFNQGVKNYENQINTEALNGLSPENLQTWNTVANEAAAEPGFPAPVTNAPVDLARYLSATPEERDKYAALLNLSNQNNTFFPSYNKTPSMDELASILQSLKQH